MYAVQAEVDVSQQAYVTSHDTDPDSLRASQCLLYSSRTQRSSSDEASFPPVRM